jgi:hypothetical protein
MCVGYVRENRELSTTTGAISSGYSVRTLREPNVRHENLAASRRRCAASRRERRESRELGVDRGARWRIEDAERTLRVGRDVVPFERMQYVGASMLRTLVCSVSLVAILAGTAMAEDPMPTEAGAAEAAKPAAEAPKPAAEPKAEAPRAAEPAKTAEPAKAEAGKSDAAQAKADAPKSKHHSHKHAKKAARKGHKGHKKSKKVAAAN